MKGIETSNISGSQQEELELQKANDFKKKYSGVLKTVDYMLSGKGQKLMDGLLEDYAPSNPKRKPGLSVGSVFKIIGFAFRNPRTIGNLITLARNYTEITNNQTFQQEVLKSDNTWKFVQTVGERLPKIGKVLANMNFPEFKENSILDTKSLTKLSTILTDSDSLASLKQIVINFKDPASNQNKNINQIFDLMIKSPGFKTYMQEKGDSLTAYIVKTAKSQIDKDESGHTKTQLKKYGIELKDLDSIAQIVPVLLNNPESLKKFYNSFNNGDYTTLAKDLLEMSKNNPAVGKYLESNKNLFVGVINASVAATPGMNGYNIKGELYPLLPHLFRHPDTMIKIVEDYEKGNSKEATQKILGLIAKDDGLKQYFKENSKNLQDLITSSVTQYIASDTLLNQLPRTKERSEEAPTELLGNKLEKYGIKIEDLSKITEIVPILLDRPEDLEKFYNNFNKGDYTALAKDLLKMSEDSPAIKDYWDRNQDIFKGVITNVVKNTPILEKYELNGELLELFGPLLTSKNASQVKVMVEKYQKSDWPGIAIDFCKMIETDPEFKKHLDNNKGNLGKIVQAVVDNIPYVKQFTGDMKIDALVANILKDPQGLREGIESYQKGGKGMVWGLAKLGVAKVLDSEFRGAVFKAAGTWLLGDGSLKQQVVDRIAKLEPSESRNNLNDLTKETIKLLDNGSEEQISQLEDLVKKNQLFSNITIKDSFNEVLKMENMDISESFVNSTFENVSFKGSKFTNSSFLNASFKNVDFSGAEIDGTVLASMELQLQKNPKLLKGVKIVGDIPPGTNLSGVDFSDVNLSEVTSMKGVNIKNTELLDAVLPSKTIFESAYNLQNARMPKGYVTEEMIANNQDKVINLMLDAMEIKNNAPLDPKFREKIVEIYKSDTPIGKKMREDLSNDPQIITQGGFPKTVQNHYSELATAASAITVLYDSRNDVASIEPKLYANIIADKISENLFGKGDNRGNDTILIRNIVNKACSNFLKANPYATIQDDVLESPRFDNMVKEITEQIRAVSKYTSIGLVSGGIYLPKTSATPELIDSVTKNIKHNVGFNKDELAQIQNLTNLIAKNLFGNGAISSRAPDTAMIMETLVETFKELKKENKNVDITGIIEANAKKLAGEVDAGYFSTTRTGLTELYYKNSTSTTVGLVSGGIYLDKQTILGSPFKSNLKSHINDQIGEELEKLAAKKITVSKKENPKKLAQTLATTIDSELARSLVVSTPPRHSTPSTMSRNKPKSEHVI
ncbi:MAG: pentapeptide repeat-containing protein [Rickettsiaceae bacterium]|nr:pentapeptide repeat-containing protein [Rickettsiaceae bacterium]